MGSHTSTGEWKSFELRMRKRRAERLLLRAGSAAESGRLEEARDCIEEARHLAPGLADIAAIQAKLDNPAPAVSPVRGPVRLSRVAAAAAAVIVAGLVVTVAAMRSAPAPLRTADLRALAPLPVPDVGRTPPVLPAVTTPAPADRPRETTDAPVDLTDRSPRVLPIVSVPPASTRDRALEPPHREAAAAVPASLEVRASPGVELPGAPAPVSAPKIDVPDDSAAVRSVLNRYAAAYSDLDAAAAQQVWPGVDHASLARAFDDLASQRVSLGDCRIDVTGPTAHASCAGSATWAPKIGDGSARTERREWSFDLSRSSGDWRILSARVQNR